MTWSAFALFLARRTEFTFNIGHFLIILPFHSLLATFQASISLIFDLFWSHCFGLDRSKVRQGSELMNTFMHGPSFFSFHFLSFSISFPKLSIITILRLYMACKMWKITALAWEVSSWRLVEKIPYLRFPHVLFSISYIDTEQIPGFLLLLKNYLFTVRSEDTIFIFHVWGYWCGHGYQHNYPITIELFAQARGRLIWHFIHKMAPRFSKTVEV